MRLLFFLLGFSLFFSSCSSTRHSGTGSFRGSSVGHSKSVGKVLKAAERYLGVPYRYGGSSFSGIDCSALVVAAFKAAHVQMPRHSAHQASKGTRIKKARVRPGDLLFFATSRTRKVSHVGIVHKLSWRGEVFFIHASTSKGVTISSLSSAYWRKAFLHAQRVL